MRYSGSLRSQDPHSSAPIWTTPLLSDANELQPNSRQGKERRRKCKVIWFSRGQGSSERRHGKAPTLTLRPTPPPTHQRILSRRITVIQHESEKGSSFSKVSFPETELEGRYKKQDVLLAYYVYLLSLFINLSPLKASYCIHYQTGNWASSTYLLTYLRTGF